MNRILIGLLIAATLALCGLCAVQWKREAEFRIRIQEIGAALKEESTKRAEAEEQVLTFEKEIARLTTLRADTEAKLLEVSARLVSVEADQLHRGNSIAVLGVELERARVEAKTAKEKIATQEKTNTVVEQNAAITQANALLKQLTTERDSAIEKLNERTRALNELVTKYNKLVK